MNEEDLNKAVNMYVKENLSPKQEQKQYINQKYEELSEFLKDNCFQSGSYPRYMAIDPVHDLDVIHPVKDLSLQEDPKLVIDGLYGLLVESYANSKISKIKKITRQTHSVTIEFADAEGEFSIDVVPAIELEDQTNEFGDSLYCVPEILQLNKYNRGRRYSASFDKPISWIKSDPKGYIKASHDLNDLNPDFRHTGKFIKSWRHACKIVYGDKFKLKSFHLEQIVYNHFLENPTTKTVKAITYCFAQLPDFLDKPKFPDRADSEKFIDDYVTELTVEEKGLILRLQAEAFNIIRTLPASSSEEEVEICLEKLLTIRKPASPNYAAFASTVVTPSQPWGK